MSPLFYLWLYFEGKRWVTLKFVVCLSPFLIGQARNGLDSFYFYGRSVLLLWTVYVTTYAFAWALLKTKNVFRLFDELIVLNFCAAIVALLVLFTPAKDLLWNSDFSNFQGTGGWAPRLNLLTTEPSVYGQLMAPLLIFSVLRLFNKPGKRNTTYAFLIAVPLILSQSFGALSICAAGLLVMLIFKSRRFLQRRSSLLIMALGLVFVVGIVVVPNPISQRIQEILAGQDSSTQVRTVAGYLEAFKIAETKSLWWGVGPGLAKLYDTPAVLRGLGFTTVQMPNAIADVLASMGLIGVIAKLILEIFFFLRTRAWESGFRLAMFTITFIYQFAGSNMMNVQEYLMWCMAFTSIVPGLDFRRIDSEQSRIEAS
jgi:hypothetical protein